ncbi:MAG: MBL fold metallo-hydrolase [Lacisediminihabitans sp.]
MLRQVAAGVRVHESEVLQTNTVVVHGDGGVLIIDAGILADEMAGIADELRHGGEPVLAGFSTHPHWDHLLWHVDLGLAPRFGTARCAALIEARLADPEWQRAVAGMIPVEIVDRVSLDDTFGRVAGLPAGATVVPWAGPHVRVIEHQAHAPGHAALLIEEPGVLVAGDMLSDALVPMLSVMAPDPIGDYLDALDLLEQAAAAVQVVIPGHGAVGFGDDVAERIALDRAYLIALRDGRDVRDPRLGPAVKPGWEWVGELHAAQRERLSRTD